MCYLSKHFLDGFFVWSSSVKSSSIHDVPLVNHDPIWSEIHIKAGRVSGQAGTGGQSLLVCCLCVRQLIQMW